jgi:hypothetical protein
MSAIEPSVLKRVKFASAFPFCRGGRYHLCELRPYLLRGEAPPRTLLPTGAHVDYLGAADSPRGPSRVRVLVADESGVFRALTAQTVTQSLPDAELEAYDTLTDTILALGSRDFDLLVCADAFADGRTAHDLRALCSVPMVVLAGDDRLLRQPPANSRVVPRNAGPEAVRSAVADALSH